MIWFTVDTACEMEVGGATGVAVREQDSKIHEKHAPPRRTWALWARIQLDRVLATMSISAARASFCTTQ